MQKIIYLFISKLKESDGANMAIRLFVDSTCDIPVSGFKEPFVTCMPLKIIMEGKEYLDGVDLTNEEFFSKLKKLKELPKTAQVTAFQFEEEFQKALDNDEEVLGVFLSSKLSGTYNSACIAKQEIGSEHIEIIDSTFTIFPYQALVREAISLIQQGLSLKEIKDKLEEMKSKIVMLAVVSDLSYLRRGGRLSVASALFATVVHIKPIMIMKNGEIVAAEKVIGTRRALTRICKMLQELDIDYTRPIYLADADGKEMKAEFIEILKEETDIFKKGNQFVDCYIGAATGSYTGPNCTGIAVFKK